MFCDKFKIFFFFSDFFLERDYRNGIWDGHYQQAGLNFFPKWAKKQMIFFSFIIFLAMSQN